MSEHYKTRQREEMLEYFHGQEGKHLTAQEVCAALKSQVSRATVYRTLDRLVQEGILRKYTLQDGQPACYQYLGRQEHCGEHYHFKCTRCGKLLHIQSAAMSQVAGELLRQQGLRLNSSMTVLYGLCRDCAEKEPV